MTSKRPWRRVSAVVVHHAYLDDGTPDQRGETRCAVCGLPESNRSHLLPDRTADERDVERRRMGEDDE